MCRVELVKFRNWNRVMKIKMQKNKIKTNEPLSLIKQTNQPCRVYFKGVYFFKRFLFSSFLCFLINSPFFFLLFNPFELKKFSVYANIFRTQFFFRSRSVFEIVCFLFLLCLISA